MRLIADPPGDEARVQLVATDCKSRIVLATMVDDGFPEPCVLETGTALLSGEH